MTLSGKQFNHASVRLLAAASLASALACAPGIVLAADHDMHQDRTELRIKTMHTKLKITPAEEIRWGKVADAMRADAKHMDALIQARSEHAKGMTAVDDLKSYSEITEARADGVKKLIPVFSDLYASMSDEQKKAADNLFRHGEHKPLKAK
ncbi:MAG: Spy/CpxP family protein refolding chaperone [Sulfuriferula sp.]